MNFQLRFPTLLCLLMLAAPAWATVTIDRDYQLGDDGVEGAVTNGQVGANFTNMAGDRFTADSAGTDTVNFVDFQDLTVLGTPFYRDVSARPIITSGRGVEFDGVDDVLHGFRLNNPEESAGAVPGFPRIYAGLQTRGMQMWVRPAASALGTPGSPTTRQGIVMDTGALGGVSITATGMWTQTSSGHLTDGDPVATVAVVGDTWQHVMQHAYLNTDNNAPRVVAGTGAARAITSVVYVNGVAVAANNDNFTTGQITAGPRVGRLSVGAEELVGDGTIPTFGNHFTGLIDDLELYVSGDNSTVTGGQNYGPFDLFSDNEWIRNEILSLPGGTLQAGDLNKDGTVNSADVTAFVAGWLSENRLQGTHNAITAGDWLTWESGDMNHDGRTDLLDWSIVNAANPGAGSLIMAALGGSNVPEPGSMALAGLACMALGLIARRRRA